MLKNKRVSKMLSLLIIMIMVLGNFTSIVNAQENQIDSAKVELQKEASEKIQLEVKTDLEKEGLAEVLVYMKEQADTEMVAKATKAAVSNY
ncbi:hypothetical protein, partial [Schnuerera sp.]|uniref:hypothetical protein n=1 Tax=Schnuerera sp. TaxID=2794844 RepID=UPI002BA01A45